MIRDKRTRRDFLIRTVAVGSPLISLGSTVRSAGTSVNRKRVLRVAYMSDTHIQPERGAPAGVSKALRHIHELDDRPGLILTGGDSIMDSFGANRQRTEVQWELWDRVFQNECEIEVRSCIGNHDIWGWNKEASLTDGTEAGWGKQLAVERLKLPNRYYSFDKAGWHFIALDSVQPHPENPNGYLALLDDEQYSWLVGDLLRTPETIPVLVFSHIPILTVTVLTHGRVQNNRHDISGGSMHLDAARLKDLFAGHSNVRLCLSGHIHLVDSATYNGVTYCCNGAVCGSWWQGDNRECDEGYAIIDLFDDGSFDVQYVVYDWIPRA